MSTLSWTRGKKDTTYGGATEYTVTHTTYTATLTGDATALLTKVDDLYFLDLNGKRAAAEFFHTLRDGKAYVQRVEDKIAAKVTAR